MTADDAIDVLDRLEAAGVEVWVDGGWGVDALLGVETRPHGDLDIVVRQEQLAAARVALVAAGFSHAADEAPGLPARLVLRDPEGRQVDVHPVEFDEAGDGRQDLGNGEFGIYPSKGLTGVGVIGRRRVRCLTPEIQLAHHRGYDLPPHERHDLALLACAFGFD
jgi:lincosamide nucleotidyltransferase A/C/D/E